MSGDGLIKARGLVKRFDGFTAVDHIDFSVAPGETFGFLGPNGAGKTSVMRMIATTSPVTEGTLHVFGMDASEEGATIRARLGVVAQDDNLDTDLSVWDNLYIYGRYFGLDRQTITERAEQLLEFAQLTDRRDDTVDPLSGGMKRRLSIARSLINEPDLFLLDEPTTGLDPQARHLLWERLWSLKRQGVTLVITTHYMDEAEQLCDRLVVMDRGRIVDEGSPRGLIEKHCKREVIEGRYLEHDDQAEVAARLEREGERVESLSDRLLLYADDADAAADLLSVDAIVPQSTLVRRATLEDVFLTLTGRTLEET